MSKQVKVKTVSVAPIQSELEAMFDDVEKFNKGVNAPGSRIRKAAQNIKVLCQQLRKDVTDIKNSR